MNNLYHRFDHFLSNYLSIKLFFFNYLSRSIRTPQLHLCHHLRNHSSFLPIYRHKLNISLKLNFSKSCLYKLEFVNLNQCSLLPIRLNNINHTDSYITQIHWAGDRPPRNLNKASERIHLRRKMDIKCMKYNILNTFSSIIFPKVTLYLKYLKIFKLPFLREFHTYLIV